MVLPLAFVADGRERRQDRLNLRLSRGFSGSASTPEYVFDDDFCFCCCVMARHSH
jgi:hypothetical protein